MDWSDFNLDKIFHTPDGKATVQSINKSTGKVYVQILESGNLKVFDIAQINVGFGQIKLTHCFQIGEFILLFQRLENRFKDFLYYTLDLSKIQRKELTTAGRLKSKIDDLYKRFATEEQKREWKDISTRAQKLLDTRNNLIHGYMFHFNGSHELDYSSLYFENSNGKSEILNQTKLDELSQECLEVYYKTHQLFSESCDAIKKRIQN